MDKGKHIITVKTEHKAVLATCEYLETKGFEVTYLDVDENGLVSLDELTSAITNTTLLIAVMYANNETEQLCLQTPQQDYFDSFYHQNH